MQELDPGIYTCFSCCPFPFDEPPDGSTAAQPKPETEPPPPQTPADDPADATPRQFETFLPLQIVATAYHRMTDFLFGNRPEVGGLIVGIDGQDLITHFIPDLNARTTSASYAPNVEWLNPLLKQLVACGLTGKGIAHSHPPHFPFPSMGDLQHVRSTFGRAKNASAEKFFLPIACGKALYPYVITRDQLNHVQLAKLILV